MFQKSGENFSYDIPHSLASIFNQIFILRKTENIVTEADSKIFRVMLHLSVSIFQLHRKKNVDNRNIIHFASGTCIYSCISLTFGQNLRSKIRVHIIMEYFRQFCWWLKLKGQL